MSVDPPLEPRTRERAAVRAGIRDGALVVLGYIPFGVAAGIVLASTGLGPGLLISSSPIIFAGAAQLVAVQLVDQGAALALVVLTVAVVNARHLLYSASLQPHLADWSRGTRMLGAFLLADPVYALAYSRFQGPDGGGARRERIAYYFAAGVTCLIGWSGLVAAGLVAGRFVPEWVPLGLAIPMTFLLLLLPLVKDLPGAVAAIVGGLVAFAAHGFPLGTGILLGAAAGILAGALVMTRTRPRAPVDVDTAAHAAAPEAEPEAGPS
ncbi:MAG: AzlC family ABC transporter permease [Actinomycetales bacterium]|nr:AzlC family ABC transporter permease [Actinomycetales bacterium]